MELQRHFQPVFLTYHLLTVCIKKQERFMYISTFSTHYGEQVWMHVAVGLCLRIMVNAAVRKKGVVFLLHTTVKIQ